MNGQISFFQCKYLQQPTYITVSDSTLFACTVLLIDNVPQDNNKTSFVLRSKLSICFFLRAYGLDGLVTCIQYFINIFEQHNTKSNAL